MNPFGSRSSPVVDARDERGLELGRKLAGKLVQGLHGGPVQAIPLESEGLESEDCVPVVAVWSGSGRTTSAPASEPAA